jgi:hypothetical protein
VEGLVELTLAVLGCAVCVCVCVTVMMTGETGVATEVFCVKVCQIVSNPPVAKQSYSKKAPV